VKIPCSCDQANDLTLAINNIITAYDNYKTGLSHGEEGFLELEETIDEADDLVKLFKSGELLL
jgi:hypothetical protein